MNDSSIVHLQQELERRFASRLRRYGSAPQEEHGLGFTIEGMDAVFSAITHNGTLPVNQYDVQIESMPPGEYLYTANVSLQELLHLVDVFLGPRSEWPQSS